MTPSHGEGTWLLFLFLFLSLGRITVLACLPPLATVKEQKAQGIFRTTSQKQTARNTRQEQGPALPSPSPNSAGCASALRKRFGLLRAALKMVEGKRRRAFLPCQSEAWLQLDFYSRSCVQAPACQALGSVSTVCPHCKGRILPAAKAYEKGEGKRLSARLVTRALTLSDHYAGSVDGSPWGLHVGYLLSSSQYCSAFWCYTARRCARIPLPLCTSLIMKVCDCSEIPRAFSSRLPPAFANIGHWALH